MPGDPGSETRDAWTAGLLVTIEQLRGLIEERAAVQEACAAGLEAQGRGP